jgi:hypothetical protein
VIDQVFIDCWNDLEGEPAGYLLDQNLSDKGSMILHPPENGDG